MVVSMNNHRIETLYTGYSYRAPPVLCIFCAKHARASGAKIFSAAVRSALQAERDCVP